MTNLGPAYVLAHVTRSVSVLAALALCVSPAAAQPDLPLHDALRAPLRGFTTSDLRSIQPMLEQGAVGMIELDEPPVLPGIHLAVEVNASADTLYEILSHPEGFPEFMPALSDVTVVERHGRSVAYEWHWQTSVFSLGGHAMLTTYAPGPAQRQRGYRIVVERTDGDLGRGREVWRIVPRGEDRSLLTLSTRMDLRDANYVTRQMQSAGRSLSRSITLTLGLGKMLRAQEEAERRAGLPPRTSQGELHRPTIDMRALEPLLRRGDVILVEAAGAELRQAAVMTRYERPDAQVRSIMIDPVAFAQALIQGSSATIAGERTETGVEFDWRVDLPLVGTGGSMRLSEQPDTTIELEGLEGAMQGGVWRFVTSALPSGATGVLGWARFEVADANFLLRAIIDADRGFRAGLSAATLVMMARALRIRLLLMRPDEVHVPAG